MGNIYFFKEAMHEEAYIEYVVVKQHFNTPSLWYVLPMIHDYQVGSWDVNLPESALCGPSVIHSANGLWIHIDDFSTGQLTGLVEYHFVQKAVSLLFAMVSGHPLRHRPSSVDDDPDYQEICQLVAQSVAKLETIKGAKT